MQPSFALPPGATSAVRAAGSRGPTTRSLGSGYATVRATYRGGQAAATASSTGKLVTSAPLCTTPRPPWSRPPQAPALPSASWAAVAASPVPLDYSSQADFGEEYIDVQGTATPGLPGHS
ncbi:hypothetical protein MRX96_015372 [Rhipicephalus microplus]